MMRFLKQEAGTTLVELTVAVALFAMVIGAAYYVLDTGNIMYSFAKDGFEAQDQGRLVLAKVTKYARQGETMNVPGYPVMKADKGGTYFDTSLDTNADGATDLVRFELMPDSSLGSGVMQIVMHIDYREGGKFRYQSVAETKAAYDSSYPPGSNTGWDETIQVAAKVVSKPVAGSAYADQTPSTNPQSDKRVFTFYGNDMKTPLSSADPVWMNSIRGVKILVLTDIRPAQIPSPFQVETNLNFRNLVRGE